MNTQIKETVGFLSRWVLLTLAGGLLVMVGVLAGWSMSELGSGPQVSLVLPDALVNTGVRFWTRGRAVPHIKSAAIRGIVADPNGRPLVAWSSDQGYCSVGQAASQTPGRVSWDYDPLPFGRLAFIEAGPIAEICLPSRRLTLVDLRLLGERPEDIARGVQQWGAAVGRGSQSAWVHIGPLEAYNAVRTAIRKAGSDGPVLMDVRSPGRWKTTFTRATRYIRRTPADRVRIVTADQGLALWAARKGYAAHLVGASGSVISPPKNLRIHSDMQMLEEFLSAGAMNQ
jgi:hypothetical protein